MSLFTSFLFALMTSMLLVPVLQRYAGRLGLIDTPDPRKVHERLVPRSGGVAIVAGALLPIVLWAPADSLLAHLLLGAMVIVLIGLVDDRQDLDYRLKFAGQALAALIAMRGGLLIEVWPFFGIDPVPAALSYPTTFMFLIGVTNAINFSDGLDGLAGGISLVTLGAIAFIAGTPAGQDLTQTALEMMVGDAEQGRHIALYSIAIIGGLCGFLRYNNYPAQIFMGDTGSQFLGFMTAGLAIALTQHFDTALNPAIVLLLFGLPILDTFSVMIWRVRTGQSPFRADRKHFHHRLLDMGFKHYEAVSTIYVVQALLVLAALAVRFSADVVVISIYLLASALIVIGFRVARVSDWRLRAPSEPGVFVERRNLWLRGMPWLHPVSVSMVEAGFASLVALAALSPLSFAPGVGIASLVAGVGLLLTLRLSGRRRRLLRRITLYGAAVLSVFVLETADAGGAAIVPKIAVNALTLALVGALVVAIRVTRRSRFSTSPLDILILIFVVVVLLLGADVATPLAPLSQVGAVLDQDQAVARLAVLFYATELLSSKGNRYLNLLSGAAGSCLLLMGMRALLLG
ncbi:MAG: MraY family glycosyltransferase [Pseudomonadota bacterium]